MIRLFFILFSFLFLNLGAHAEVDPMIDLDAPPDISLQMPNFNMKMPNVNLQSPKEYMIKKGNSSEVPIEKEKGTVQKAKDATGGFFSNLHQKIFKKKPKEKAKFDTVGGGYSGTLPNVEAEFNYKHPKKSDIKDKGLNAENYLPEEFEPSKTEDPLFLDVILNKERPTQYVSDMFRIMKFLEAFRIVIETHQDVQKFNANVNLLDLHARRIENLYKDKPEGSTSSYWLLIDLAYKAKVLGNLKFDANYYSKFSPIVGTKYDPLNILNEDKKLLDELDKTVFAIRQLNN